MVGGIENEGESMPRTRKSHPPSLKAKVAVEAIKAHKTAAQIAQMFGVHPTQVGGWKKQALAGLPDVFGNGREQMRQQTDAEKDELYKQIGQLKVELDFLQKRAGLIDSRPPPMDRSATSAPDRPPAVRTARGAALDLLLPAAAGERRKPEPAPAARRVVLGLPILRQPPDGRHAGSEPQTQPAADAHSRHPSPLSQTELEPSGAGPRDLSVPAARRFDRAAQPSLEHRYYLHSDAWRLPLFGRGHGLVQPLRAQLGTFQHHGNRLLFD